MKQVVVLFLFLFGHLVGCVSRTRNIDCVAQYSQYINATVITTRELRMHKADKHNYRFSECRLSAFLSANDYPSFKLLEVLPSGSTLYIVGARREFDSNGSWDYILGEYKSKSSGKVIRFEFPISIIEEQEGVLPFRVE